MPAAKGIQNALAVDGKIILPDNELITRYGLKNASLFKLYCKATYVTAPQHKAGDALTKWTAVKPPDPVAFEAICNAESFTVSHQHNYGAVGGLIGRATNMFKDGDTLALAKGLADWLDKGDINIGTTEWNQFSGLDTASAYQSSDPLSFELTMSLIAHKDPLLEVVFPAAWLTFLTYPTGSAQNNTDSMLKFAEGILGKRTQDKKDANPNATEEELAEMQKKGEGFVKNSQDSMKATGIADNVKYRVGNPPPVWSISSSNGIIDLESCFVKNLSVTYHGPWISSPSAEKEMEKTAVLIANALNGENREELPINTEQTKSNQELLEEINRHGGYPSWAEVKMTFVNRFGIMFGEEAIQGIMQSGKTSGQVK